MVATETDEDDHQLAGMIELPKVFAERKVSSAG